MTMTLSAALWALATSAFVSSTLFPGGSEAVFLWIFHDYPDVFLMVFSTVIIASSTGAITSYAIGQFLSKR